MLVLDGVYVEDGRGGLSFRRSKPSTRDVEGLVERIARSAERWLGRQGYGEDEDEGVDDEDNGLELLMAASLVGRVAVGARSGGRARPAGRPP